VSEREADSTARLTRHGAGFLASGAIAFTVDALVLLALTAGARLDPFSARLLAIAVAMVAGWMSHRRLTWNVAAPPTLGEFAGYAAVAWLSAAINYAVYAAVLIAWPGTWPLVALVASSLVAMAASYAGMRFGVFRHSRRL
jgi:putative flippase GtrA